MHKVEIIVSHIIHYCRWVLVAFYTGLIVALIAFAIFFIKNLYTVLTSVGEMGNSDMILSMLSMIDMTLIAGLIVMVVINGYDNFVSRLANSEDGSVINELANVKPGALKLKISMTIILISAIYVLEMLMDFQKFTVSEIGWALGIHVTLAVTGLIMAIIEKISGQH